MPRLFSYVVEHDTGHAPNPYFRICTLCRCKFRKSPDGKPNIVELAEEGDWIVGTGGANRKRSAGHGRLVYAMRVDEKLSRREYYRDPRFRKKKPVTNGSYQQQQGDNKPPRNEFERDQQFVLISRRFYYLGRNAVTIPKRFREHRDHPIEKTGPGFRSKFPPEFVEAFVKWIRTKSTGRHGEPCVKTAVPSKPKRLKRCRPSC